MNGDESLTFITFIGVLDLSLHWTRKNEHKHDGPDEKDVLC